MEQPTTTIRRPPGRPRKNPEQTALNGTTEEPETAAGPSGAPIEPAQAPKDPSKPEVANLPLFADAVFDEDRPDTIVITRTGPVFEGSLPKLPAHSTLEDIRSAYGGGEFRIEVRTTRGLSVKGGMRTINIAGEPIWQSDAKRAEYQRLIRNQMQAAPLTFPQQPQAQPAQQPQQSPAPAPAPAPPPTYLYAAPPNPPAPAPAAPSSDGFGALIAAILTAQSQQTSTMMTLIMESAKSREEATMRMFELTRQAQPADPLALMKEGIKIARSIANGKGDEEEGGVVGKIVEAAPKAFSTLRDAIREEKELRGKAAEAQAAAAAAAPTPAAIAAAMEQIRSARDKVLFEDELAKMAMAAIENMQKHDVEPVAGLAQLFQEIASFGDEQFEAASLKPRRRPAPTPPAPIAPVQPIADKPEEPPQAA